MLSPDGTPAFAVPWPFPARANPITELYEPWITLDDLDRPTVFVTRLANERGFISVWTRSQSLMKIVIDPEGPAVTSAEPVIDFLVDMRLARAIFRPDGEGGFVGGFTNAWEEGDRLVAGVELIRTRPESYCRNGNVDPVRAFDHRTLLVNGHAGDSEHVVRVAPGTPLALAIESPHAAPGVRFYVQARGGAPRAESVRWLPGVGLSCFDFRDHASADAIWNGLGTLYGKLGHSRVLEIAIPDPASAPGVFFRVPPQATAGLPPGTRITFQGIESDPASRKGFAVTNAVVLEIE
jgi:hypothetical protein